MGMETAVANTLTEPIQAEFAGIEWTPGRMACEACGQIVAPKQRAYRVVLLFRKDGSPIHVGEKFDFNDMEESNAFWRHLICQPEDRR